MPVHILYRDQLCRAKDLLKPFLEDCAFLRCPNTEHATIPQQVFKFDQSQLFVQPLVTSQCQPCGAIINVQNDGVIGFICLENVVPQIHLYKVHPRVRAGIAVQFAEETLCPPDDLSFDLNNVHDLNSVTIQSSTESITNS